MVMRSPRLICTALQIPPHWLKCAAKPFLFFLACKVLNKSVHMKLFCTILAILCFLSPLILAGETQALDVNWSAAARNRDNAAQSQSTQALALLEEADKNRVADSADADEADRRRRLSRAGALEMTAGALFWKAAANFDRGAGNWAKTAKKQAGSDGALLARQAHVKAEDARTSARHARYLAAQAYERAASSYSFSNAGNLGRSAAASEKGAECREVLARGK